ncbi:hypothetical protein UCDDA912_g08397 [Diaporthe ampelina]|uniref:Uncharacterized protein n=1 Tax=Diaporthe ampelina TaxID=1214573 RepID=A0A0G2H8T6_9PEZI|nr:hypothetical protein UCDDA912_g08397 [Diaporthe ampelina]
MPVATVKVAKGSAPPFTKRKLNKRRTPSSSTVTAQPQVHDARNGSESKLPKPLTPKARRIITKRTSRLIRKRNELDRSLLLQAFRPLDELNANDWLPREEILRQCERMASRERDHIRSRTKKLQERTALYSQDPSEERALDVDLIRKQLWKFKRHLGPYLEAAEEPLGDGEDDVPTSDSDLDSSDEDEESVQGKAGDPDSSKSSEGDAPNGNGDVEKSSIGLDGAFDDIRTPKKRKRNDDAVKGSQKKRKEQASGSTQSTTSQSQSVKAGAPKRSKEMEASIAQIFNSMSPTKSSQVSIDGASKVDAKEAPVETTIKEANGIAVRKAPKPPAIGSSSSSSSASDGGAKPFYQRHAKAMLRPDFDDLVYERPPRRRGPKSDKKHKQYLVSGALPVPHLPSPRPDKAKARSVPTDGP